MDAIKGLRIIRVSKGARLIPLKEMVSAIYVNTQARSQLGEHDHTFQSLLSLAHMLHYTHGLTFMVCLRDTASTNSHSCIILGSSF